MVLFAKFVIGEGRTKEIVKLPCIENLEKKKPSDRWQAVQKNAFDRSVPQDRITRPRYMDAQRNVIDIRPLQTKI